MEYELSLKNSSLIQVKMIKILLTKNEPLYDDFPENPDLLKQFWCTLNFQIINFENYFKITSIWKSTF